MDDFITYEMIINLDISWQVFCFIFFYYIYVTDCFMHLIKKEFILPSGRKSKRMLTTVQGNTMTLSLGWSHWPCFRYGNLFFFFAPIQCNFSHVRGTNGSRLDSNGRIEKSSSFASGHVEWN